MAFFEWTDDLDVKVEEMNNQHKFMISIMNDIYRLNVPETSKYILLRKLKELESYTRKHFRDEEAYMQSINFSGFKRHRIVHQHLLAQLSEHIQKFQSQQQLLSPQFFQFLYNYLASHIRHVDIKYGIASWSVSETAA